MSNEITNHNDQTIELKTNLNLNTPGNEFDEDAIKDMEEVRGCIDIENEDSFVDTDDIKKLIIIRSQVKTQMKTFQSIL